jgi:hypothetical protein
MSPHPLQKQVQHPEALGMANHLFFVLIILFKRVVRLASKLDLCQHTNQELVNVVVDTRRCLNVLAVVLDG